DLCLVARYRGAGEKGIAAAQLKPAPPEGRLGAAHDLLGIRAVRVGTSTHRQRGFRSLRLPTRTLDGRSNRQERPEIRPPAIDRRRCGSSEAPLPPSLVIDRTRV